MKFHTLEVENFLTLKNARINLEDRGLQLIQGQNDDDSSASSNGAGKSSLVDAICWALYGATARDVKGDAVVNLGAKKDCRVTLILSNGASRYRITRHRKHKDGKNSLVVELASADPAEAATDLSKGTDAETQKVLEKILGCSQEVFMAAVYSGQEAMPDLPKMKDRELKTLIEEAAGLQRIERAYTLARERALEAKSAAQTAQTRLDSARTAQASADLAVAEVGAKHSAWETERKARVGHAADAAVRAENELAAGVAARDRLNPDAHAAGMRVVAIDEKLAEHDALLRAAQGADAAVRRAELTIDASLLKRLAAQVATVEAQIANAATEVKKPCPECGTVLETMSAADFVAHKTRHLDKAKRKLEEGKVTARTQMAEVVRLRAAAAAAHAAVPEVSALTAERLTHEATIKKWRDASQEVKRLEGAARELKDAFILRETEPNPHESALELARKNVASSAAKVGEAETAVKAETERLEVAAAVVKVFGPAGVRAQILDTVTPFLNARTADYLSALSDGEITAVWTTLTKSASGDLKEKFSIDVTHAKGGDSFAALSGGEKRKVRLAAALALQDLVASRAANSIDLWVGDEVDDALDPAGLERLMTILERKARERGTVLVISHSDLRDWIDNVTTVRKSEQWSSKVEGSLCS